MYQMSLEGSVGSKAGSEKVGLPESKPRKEMEVGTQVV